MNLGVDLAPSVARTNANDGNVDVSNPDGQACHLVVDVTVNAGGLGSVVPIIQGKDPLSGKKWNILVGPTLTAIATAIMKIGAGIPFVETDVDNSATGAAGAIAATLAAAAGARTYITGFEITGAGATAASVVVVTVTGVLGGTKSYELVVPAGAGVSVNPLIVEFSRPIPANADNVAIVVNVPSLGAGNLNAAVTAHGFQRTSGLVASDILPKDLSVNFAHGAGGPITYTARLELIGKH